MLSCYTATQSTAIPIHTVNENDYRTWLSEQPTLQQKWLETTGFKVKPGSYCLLPNEQGALVAVVVAQADDLLWGYADLATRLPVGEYYFTQVDDNALFNRALAWGLECYRFAKYKKNETVFARLVLPNSIDSEHLETLVTSIYWLRDLINTPTQDMGPQQLAEVTQQLAMNYNAQYSEVVGDALITANFPAIHAVGRASAQLPRLLELRWGKKTDPKLALIGKGVCFDSGGLDIKTSSAMTLMKKDMGGAAHALALARMIMALGLPLQLQVLIPAVENAISGNAYRPGDVVSTRAGKTVEIGNTDAEGRVILADALSYAVESQPRWIIDFATLTGAARVALGTDVPALFSNDDAMATGIHHMSKTVNDLLWPMPLFQPYNKLIESPIADLNNAGNSPYAGAITAALFLQAFVPASIPWVHIDVMAWNVKARPGRPEGGEAMGLRALFEYLRAAL